MARERERIYFRRFDADGNEDRSERCQRCKYFDFFVLFRANPLLETIAKEYSAAVDKTFFPEGTRYIKVVFLQEGKEPCTQNEHEDCL